MACPPVIQALLELYHGGGWLLRSWVREFARHRLRRAAYVGVPRAVVEQMMQQEAMRVRLHGQPAAEPPYADFFAWAGQQPAAARGGGGG